MNKCEMTVSRAQFEALRDIYEDFAGYSKSENTKDRINELKDLGFVDLNGITEAGLEALEPYKVKRVVIMAAGFGVRLAPVTLNTPKPLVRVHGKRIIDSLLDAIYAAGIEEVVIVRGYLAEQFDQLLYKYPNLKFIENAKYNEANNIGSMVCAKDLLENAYVMEADLLLSNPRLVRKYHYTSNFLGIPVDTSSDWCFTVKDGMITAQVTDGRECEGKLGEGETLYQEVGISYWNADAGKKLARHLVDVFEREGGHARYWDQVPLVDFKDEYDVEILPCNASDIVEIDCFHELVAIDSAYAVNK